MEATASPPTVEMEYDMNSNLAYSPLTALATRRGNDVSALSMQSGSGHHDRMGSPDDDDVDVAAQPANLPLHIASNQGSLDGNEEGENQRDNLQRGTEDGPHSGEPAVPSGVFGSLRSPMHQNREAAQIRSEQLELAEARKNVLRSQWRLVPLDILVSPPISAIAPFASGRHSVAGRYPTSILGAFKYLLFSYRRFIVEPLVDTEVDTFLDVWRKNIFCALFVFTCFAYLMFTIGGIVDVIRERASIRTGSREPFIILTGLLTLATIGNYIVCRRLKRLVEWQFLIVHIVSVGLFHLLLAANGLAPAAILINSLNLLVWLFGVDSITIKAVGVFWAFASCVIAAAQSVRLGFPIIEGGAHNSTGNDSFVFSVSFVYGLAVFQAAQSLFSIGSFALTVISHDTTHAADRTAQVIQFVTRSLIRDDFDVALKLMSSAAAGGLRIFEFLEGDMLAQRFAEVAECLKYLRMYIPEYVFQRFEDLGAAIKDNSGNADMDLDAAGGTGGGVSATGGSRTGNGVGTQATVTDTEGIYEMDLDMGDTSPPHVIQMPPATEDRSAPLFSLAHNHGDTDDMEVQQRNTTGSGPSSSSSNAPLGHPPSSGGLRLQQQGADATSLMSPSNEMGNDSTTSSRYHRRDEADQRLTFTSVTLILVQYRGEMVAVNPERLERAMMAIREYMGMVENVAYDHMLVSFPGESVAQITSALHATTALNRIFYDIGTTAAHNGKAWAGVCRAGSRRWRFIGGDAAELLWKLPSVAQMAGTTCVATESVAQMQPSACCPIDLCAMSSLATAEIVFEISDELEFCPGMRSTLPTSIPTSFVTYTPLPTTTPRMRYPLGITGILPAVPLLHANRIRIQAAMDEVSKGKLRRALECLSAIESPSPHMLSLIRDIESAMVKKRLYYKKWLGWGAPGAPAQVSMTNDDDEVTIQHDMGDSQTSMSGILSTVRQQQIQQQQQNALMGGSTTMSMMSTFDRVTQSISKRQKQLEEQVMEGSGALFEMFITPESGEDIATYIIDNAGRRWKRGQRTFGRGSYGYVFSASGEFGNPVAVKCMDLESRVISASAEEVSREIHTLSSLRHDNIVGYIGDALQGQYYYIFMECVPGGSLAGLLSTFKRLPMDAVARYVRDALLGLHYLHRKNVVHCDIKPANILITGHGRCKLSDFGSAYNKVLSEVSFERAERQAQQRKKLQSEQQLLAAERDRTPEAALMNDTSSSLVGGTALDTTETETTLGEGPLGESSAFSSSVVSPTTQVQPSVAVDHAVPQHDEHEKVPQVSSFAGTPRYMSPEACRGQISEASDVWSLGITVFELITGELPWTRKMRNMRDANFIHALSLSEEPLKDMEWGRIECLGDSHAIAFCRACLVVDPEERMRTEWLLGHPFLSRTLHRGKTNPPMF